MNGISVIVCCYNSAARIAETLKYLARQKINSSVPWEVIVVNNASSDSTRAIAATSWKENDGHQNFQIVEQPIPGLASARQKGVEVSRYDFIIFCDDDNHFEPNYVEEAFHLMIHRDEVGIAGGWVKPKLPFYPGKWIEPNYAALAIGKRAEQNGYIDWVFGAGMVFRKKILEDLKIRKIGLLLSDRKGKSQSSGGDAEMCQLARFLGYKVYFTPNLVLHHKIDGERLTKKSFIKSNLQNLSPTVYLYILENLIQNKNKSLRRLVLSLLRKRIIRILNAFPRLVLGRNSFLNFMEIYVGSVLVSWILLHQSEIKKSFVDIKQNLYNGPR
jgi:glycosyltransferase involved in cell wall biosynthesis